MRALVSVAVLTLAIVIGGALTAWRLYEDSHELVHSELRMRTLIGQIGRLDEVFSMSTKLAVATGSPAWELRYRDFAPQLRPIVAEMLALEPHGGKVAIGTVDAASRALEKMNEQAFALMRAGRRDEAERGLLGTEYETQKAALADGIDALDGDVMDRTEGLVATDRTQLAVAAAAAGLALAVLAALWWRIISLIRWYVTATRQAKAALQDANSHLEQRVAERTTELVQSNERLRVEMDERQRMQTELRHAQKLEAVGRLAAGVAHEINTPVQFVNDSLFFLKGATKDLFEVLERYRVLPQSADTRDVSRQTLAEEASALAASVNLPYLLSEVPEAIEMSMEGMSRIAGIVRSMKDFAHPDKVDMAPVDLNRAVTSTLTIAGGEYKYVAAIETDLGDLPEVTCHGGSIQQVVLNLLVNAAHAVGDVVKTTKKVGRIAVTTRQEGSNVIISVADTGGGIPEHVRELVFDPFFTTKEMGKGTGQGLALAHSIVRELHGGDIWFETETGRGTTFFVRLPIEPPASAHARAA